MTFKHVMLIGALSLLTACANNGSREDRQQEAPTNIYDALENDNIQYRDDSAPKETSQTDPAFLKEKLGEVRSLFFRYKYQEATDLAERLIRLDSSLTEAYYWLARIHMANADYSQAFAMASKGLSVAGQSRMKSELERIKRQAQMGAN